MNRPTRSLPASIGACATRSKGALRRMRRWRRRSRSSAADEIVYTPAALADLAEIADWLTLHYPTLAPAVEHRFEFGCT